MTDTTERSRADAMNADAYRAALAGLSLTQSAGARLLGVDARTSRKWATGEREVPPTAARLLRFLIATGTPAAAVHAALGEEA